MPDSWRFDKELLELLWVLDATVDRLPALAALFEKLMAAEHLPAKTFPVPTDAERQGPSTDRNIQPTLAYTPET